MAYTKSHEGRFIPRHPERYFGDIETIWFRSNPELQFMNYLDIDPYIESWTSEHSGTMIEYEYQGQIRKYFPDFLVRFSDDRLNRRKNKLTQSRESVCLIELKPRNHFDGSHPHSDADEVAVNQAKFEAARKFCAERNWSFRVLDISSLV